MATTRAKCALNSAVCELPSEFPHAVSCQTDCTWLQPSEHKTAAQTAPAKIWYISFNDRHSVSLVGQKNTHIFNVDYVQLME